MPLKRDGFGRPVPVPPDVRDPLMLGSETEPSGSIVIFIKGEPYSLIVQPLRDDQECRVMYRLTKVGGETYCLVRDWEGECTCDCKSFVYKKHQVDPSGCKHIVAMSNAGLFNLEWRKPVNGNRNNRHSLRPGD